MNETQPGSSTDPDTAAALTEWNHRPDIPETERMTCRVTEHGFLVARSRAGLWWECPACSERQPVLPGQVTVALGSERLPIVPMDDSQVRIPPGTSGNLGHGNIRLSATAQLAQSQLGRASHTGITGASLAGLLSGLGLGGLIGNLLHGAVSTPSAMLIAFVLAIFGGMAGEGIRQRSFPVSRIVASAETSADSLQPGHWVPTRPGPGPFWRATRVVQVSGLSVNHRFYPGVRIKLLNGDTVECHRAEAWTTLTIGLG